jgi:hypothetical protein
MFGHSDSDVDESHLVETTDQVDDQISILQALKDPRWCEAMQEEIDSLIANLTWELTSLPPGKHALNPLWVFKSKPEVNPTRTRLKAQLVARGFEQKFGIDYNETFAPVVRWSTLRAMVALSVFLGWELNHMDVITAFLNGKLKEEIYMKQPPGFEVPGQEDKVCRLLRSLSGLS